MENNEDLHRHQFNSTPIDEDFTGVVHATKYEVIHNDRSTIEKETICENIIELFTDDESDETDSDSSRSVLFIYLSIDLQKERLNPIILLDFLSRKEDHIQHPPLPLRLQIRCMLLDSFDPVTYVNDSSLF